jgi:excisionase family DNA binding protein
VPGDGPTEGTALTAGTEARIGLAEAAERLGVHYMTAYRYVRTGRLPAVSVDGRWQVDPADLVALAADGPVRRVRGGSRAGAAAHLEARLLEGDEAGAFAICEDALAAWATPADIHLDLLVPALRSIGRRWEEGELTVADEHRASAVATRVLGRFGPRFVRPGRRRGSVVIGAPAGDRHSLPVMMVGDLLRDAGYAVVDLGADTPGESFVEAARSADRLVAVAIGATLTGNEGAVTAAVAALHAGVPGAVVIVGGAAVPDEAAADQVGADRWSGPDGRSMVARVTAG